MDKDVRDFVIQKTHDLIAAPSCCKEAKAAGEAWLKAVGTADEKAETKKFLKEVQEDIMPINGLIDFAESDMGIKIFGSDTAKNVAAHAREVRDNGGKYCDCPACTACAAILSKKVYML